MGMVLELERYLIKNKFSNNSNKGENTNYSDEIK